MYAAFQIGNKNDKIIPRTRVNGRKQTLLVGVSIGDISLDSSLAVCEMYKPFVPSVLL